MKNLKIFYLSLIKNLFLKKNKKLEKDKRQVPFTVVWFMIKSFVRSVMRIEDTDYEGTMNKVEEDMLFRGHSAWILIFSILIASIGLNANSTAVIIGAMLISPLMGPIVASGLAIGINDFSFLKRALKNFAVAILISLITSAIYFKITPLKEATSELLGRTTPTILDVFIALFGGFAGIIAGSRKESSNVIPGVAIATALMPPLCTAGYGIATWQGHFFFGALYLFFINSVFISLATFVTVKLLKFPKKKHINPETERRVKHIITFIVILFIIPSLILFFNVIKEARFKTNAKLFIKKEISNPGSQLINYNLQYSDTVASINLYFIGKPVQDSSVNQWIMRLADYNLVTNGSFLNKVMIPDTTVLHIYQSADVNSLTKDELNKINQNIEQEVKVGILEEIYDKNAEMLAQRDKQIDSLQKKLQLLEKRNLPVEQLNKEVLVQYPYIVSVSFSRAIIPGDSTIDTLPTFIVKWKPGVSYYYKKRKSKTLKEWLKVRFDLDTLVLIDQRTL